MQLLSRQSIPYLPRLGVKSRRGRVGQGLVEYALIIAMIAILLVGAVVLYKNELSSLYSTIVAGMP